MLAATKARITHWLARAVLFSISLLCISVLFSMSVLAQEENGTISAKFQEGGSYELFWPMTAGRAMDDKFYFLKLWREDLGGIFIFDVAKKSDYEVVLSTKRILEAEKLLRERKNDLAGKTLDKALSQLTLARGNFSRATKSGDEFQKVNVNLKNQLSNLRLFVPKLSEMGEGSLKEKGFQIQDMAEKFLADVTNP